MAQVRSENGDGDLSRQRLAGRLVTVVGESCMKVKNNSVTLFSASLFSRFDTRSIVRLANVPDLLASPAKSLAHRLCISLSETILEASKNRVIQSSSISSGFASSFNSG